jgi:hypothetical protein
VIYSILKVKKLGNKMPKISKYKRRSNFHKKVEISPNENIFDQEELPLLLVESSKNQEIRSFQMENSSEELSLQLVESSKNSKFSSRN